MIHLIHDNRRTEMLSLADEQFHRQRIYQYKIWDAVMRPTVIQSINASHKQIIRWAKTSGHETITIAEDDIMFPAEDAYQFFLKNMPTDFDIYFGGTYEPINPDMTVTIPVGMHFYMCHERFYDKFLSVPDDVHIDTAMSGLGRFVVCHPMIALQRPGLSLNIRDKVDYNLNLKSEDVYGW